MPSRLPVLPTTWSVQSWITPNSATTWTEITQFSPVNIFLHKQFTSKRSSGVLGLYITLALSNSLIVCCHSFEFIAPLLAPFPMKSCSACLRSSASPPWFASASRQHWNTHTRCPLRTRHCSNNTLLQNAVQCHSTFSQSYWNISSNIPLNTPKKRLRTSGNLLKEQR